MDPQATPTSASTLQLGATTETATLGGTIVAAAIAGTFSNLGPPNPGANVNNPIQGANLPNGQSPNVASSTGLAGSGGALILTDKVLSYNMLSGTTMAGVFGASNTSRASVTTAGDLDVSATNDESITAIGVSAGVTTAAEATAAAFTMGINILSTSSNVFNRSNSNGLIAEIQNANVSTGGAVSVTATDDSSILSIGGAFAVSAKGNFALGAGLGWDQIALVIDAEINSSTITAGAGVSVQSLSSQVGNPLSSKIVSASVGGAVSVGGQGPGTAIGANVSVNGTFNTITALVDTNSIVTAGSAVAIGATDNSTISALSGAVAIATGSSGTAAGAALGANYISNIVTASIDTSKVTANGGDVSVVSDEEANIQALDVGLQGAQTYAVGGSISVAVITDTVVASIAGAATVAASGVARVKSTNNATIGTLAGQVAIGGKVGVGISVVSSTIVDQNSAFISGTATVTGTGGVSVTANTTETPSVFAVGGALGGSVAGVAFTTTVTVVDDTTLAYIDAVPTGGTAGKVQGGTGSGSSGDVIVDAESTFNLLGTDGSLTWGGKAGIGVGVDAGVVTRRTQAYIGASAKVSADGSASVIANASETIYSFSIAGAAAGTVAVGLTAGVSTLNLTTNAYVDTGAVVFAKNNAVISAEDQTGLILVSGNLTGSGTVAVGIGAGISVLNKNTNASINSDAVVTALANGAAAKVNTGQFGTSGSNNTPVASASAQFTSADLNGNTITASGTGGLNGLQTGDAVVYDGASLPLGGLNSGGTYYVIVTGTNKFQLAATQADALAGRALTLTAGLTNPTDQHTIERLTSVGVPTTNTSNVPTSQLNLSNLAQSQIGDPVQALRRGVVVVAVSANTFQTAGAAGGGSGSVAVQVAGAISVHTINTSATIQSGAKINQLNDTGANAAQSVYVDAGRSYYDLLLALGAAFSGAVSVSPTVGVPVLQGSTLASISGPASGSDTTLVNAQQNVEVAAVAAAEFIGISVGLAGSGTAAVAGSATVIVVSTTTQASIGGLAVVEAGGNVLVAAIDTTIAYNIAGAVGIGIGGGAGAGTVAVSLITKDTNAYIQDGAIVDAAGNGPALTGIMNGTLTGTQSINGVAVQAYSSETLTNVAGAGSGGLYVGIAGGADVEQVSSNTVAAIFSGAQINQNPVNGFSTNAAQSVAVGARNDLKITAVAGAIAIGAAGIGAGVDVEVIRNNAIALIGDGVRVGAGASGTVNIDALSTRNILSVAVAVGAGVFGLGGGISVISIGGAFDSTYFGQGQNGKQQANSLSGSNNTNVLPSLDTTIDSAESVLTTPNSGGLPAINPATAVDNTNHTVNFGVTDNLATGDAVEYSSGGGQPISGLQSGQTYFVIVVSPSVVELAATRDDALAGRFIPITSTGATGTSHQFSATSSDIANAARVTASPALPNNAVVNGTSLPPPPPHNIASGTSAVIDSDAVVTANTVSVQANQTLTVQSFPGGAGLGGVAIGLGLAVINVSSGVSAYVSPQVEISGLAGSGSLQIDATRNATISSLGIAGSVSGFVSLGAAVAFVKDMSSVRATLGVQVTDTGFVAAASSADATSVDGAGFAQIEVKAQSTETMNLSTGAAGISVVAGLGAAITLGDIEGNAQALIGDFRTIGTAVTPVGGVTIGANRNATIQGYQGGPMGIALSGGLLGGSGPSLKFGGVDVMAGQFGPWTPIGAVATATGYEVAWKNGSADQYTVWSTDSNGNYIASLIPWSSGNSVALEGFEPTFGQDLNSDGVIGLYAAPGTTLQVTSPLAGASGATTIGAGATLVLSAADSASTTFASSTGSLVLTNPSTFTGTIFGFTGNGTLAGSDQIDLKWINSTSAQASYAAGQLTVTDGTATARLKFNGSYAPANFKFASDGSGGTIVYDPPTTSSAALPQPEAKLAAGVFAQELPTPAVAPSHPAPSLARSAAGAAYSNALVPAAGPPAAAESTSATVEPAAPGAQLMPAFTPGAPGSTTVSRTPTGANARLADTRPAATPINGVAIAQINPAQVMSLINTSTIKLPVHRVAETATPANETLVFDESTGALVPAANPAPHATAPLVESLGAEWLIVVPSPASARPTTTAGDAV